MAGEASAGVSGCFGSAASAAPEIVSGSVIQDGQQITANVTDFGGVVAHTLQHILNVGLLQRGKAFLDNLTFELRSSYPEGCLRAAKDIGDSLHQLVHGFPVLFGECDVANLLLNLCFAWFSIHPIHLGF